jgi:hypothetical protein
MMWQISFAMLVWLAASVGGAVLVGHVLRRSSAALDVCAPRFRGEGPSSLDMVRTG